MSYKTFESYQDSLIRWIGEIPHEWSVIRLKFLLDVISGGCWGDEDNDDTGTFVLRSTEITLDGKWSINNPAKRQLKNDELSKCLLKENDLLVTKSSGSEKHIGKTAIVTKDVENLNCCFSNFMTRLHTNDKFNPKLLYYLLNSIIVKSQFNYMSNSTVGLSNLNDDSFKRLVLPFMEMEYQNCIVSYLDKKTSEIDENIAKNKELISLLEEKKTALINQVVTKGLDHDVPMKDSGIEWIGEIPEHWGIFKLKHICDTFGRIGFRGYTSSDLVSEGEGAYTIGGKHIQNNKLDLSDPEYLSWEKYYESPEIMVELNDLIITQRGTLGKTAFIDEQIGPATINPSMILLKNVSCNPKFLYYFLCSSFIINNINLLNTQTAVPMISQEQANNFIVLLPDVNEQNDISEYLDKKIESIEKTIEKVQENIDLLDEYKTSLIHHVVTGKIDVRDEV